MPHWAKVEIPEDKSRRAKLVQRIRKRSVTNSMHHWFERRLTALLLPARYPVQAFNTMRERVDPKGILLGRQRLLNTLLVDKAPADV